MTTLLFLSGAGSGALVAIILMILALRSWSNAGTKQGQAVIDNNKHSLEALLRRNEISARQCRALERMADAMCDCRHCNVTVTATDDDGAEGHCDDCGKQVEYDRDARKWK